MKTKKQIKEKKESIREPTVRHIAKKETKTETDLPVKKGFRIWQPGYVLKKGEIINQHHRLNCKVVVNWPPGGKK